MPQIAVQTVNLIDEKITILFNQNWFQEDITILSPLLLDNISNHQIVERIQGADRESIRFRWQDADFILNFDFYSQSCWICPQDRVSILKILPLLNHLGSDIA